MSKKIIKQNTKVIDNFFYMHDQDTAKNLSKFLFDLQGMYLSQLQVTLSAGMMNESLLNFSLLYDLVNELQPVKESK